MWYCCRTVFFIDPYCLEQCKMLEHVKPQGSKFDASVHTLFFLSSGMTSIRFPVVFWDHNWVCLYFWIYYLHSYDDSENKSKFNVNQISCPKIYIIGSIYVPPMPPWCLNWASLFIGHQTLSARVSRVVVSCVAAARVCWPPCVTVACARRPPCAAAVHVGQHLPIVAHLSLILSRSGPPSSPAVNLGHRICAVCHRFWVEQACLQPSSLDPPDTIPPSPGRTLHRESPDPPGDLISAPQIQFLPTSRGGVRFRTPCGKQPCRLGVYRAPLQTAQDHTCPQSGPHHCNP
jgi:hypothetical protein